MALLRAQYGLMGRLAKGLGITRAAVSTWKQVPAHHLVEIERISGIPREKLRPELYRTDAGS